jgi:hypothetical protein
VRTCRLAGAGRLRERTATRPIPHPIALAKGGHPGYINARRAGSAPQLVAANAVERIAAGQAVLEQLLVAGSGTMKPHVVLAPTHDGELVDLAEAFGAYHFGDSIGPDSLMFDHRLQHGPATTRNALLRLHGAPETLLSQAVTTAEMLDRQRGTTLVPR